MARPGKWEEHALHINSELKRLHDGQKEMGKTLQQNTVVLEKNTVLLEEHMRRTAAVEASLEEIRSENKRELGKVEEKLEKGVEKLEQDIAPVKVHIKALKLIAKIGGGIVALAGAAAAVVKVLEFFYG